MNLQAFEHLELIPELLKTIKSLEDRLQKLTPPLVTKKEVAKFLGVTPRTLNNYISNGYFKEGYHFKRKNDKILVFIEDAIIEFRDKRDKGMVK
jgi:predicted transcriptional regulator